MKTNIPEILKKQGKTPMYFVQNGMSLATAYRIGRGEDTIRLCNFRHACEILGVSLDEAIGRSYPPEDPIGQPPK